MKRTTGIRARSPQKVAAHRQHQLVKAELREKHPYCQGHIWELGLNEAEVIANGGRYRVAGKTCTVPKATVFHHRNKRLDHCLYDPRWLMHLCQQYHDGIENNKSWARSFGLLLPIQADKDGKWGSDNQALTTDELLAKAAK